MIAEETNHISNLLNEATIQITENPNWNIDVVTKVIIRFLCRSFLFFNKLVKDEMPSIMAIVKRNRPAISGIA